MPRTIYTSESDRSGISITYYKTNRDIAVFGWYDSCVGIEGKSWQLAEFLTELGVTEHDCTKAFKKYRESMAAS